jgi:hypothetical protein
MPFVIEADRILNTLCYGILSVPKCPVMGCSMTYTKVLPRTSEE